MPRPASVNSAEPLGLSAGSFDDLAKETMTPASIVRARRRADYILDRMRLDELRKARKVTQSRLAATMRIQQSEVSRIEQRREVRLRTLREYVGALGGHIEIRAVFPDKNVELVLGGE